MQHAVKASRMDVVKSTFGKIIALRVRGQRATGQGNHFEFIPTVSMESQHSTGVPTCHDFPRFVIVFAILGEASASSPSKNAYHIVYQITNACSDALLSLRRQKLLLNNHNRSSTLFRQHSPGDATHTYEVSLISFTSVPWWVLQFGYIGETCRIIRQRTLSLSTHKIDYLRYLSSAKIIVYDIDERFT